MAEETVVNGGVTSDFYDVDNDDRNSEEEEETITKRDQDLDLRKDSEISELKKKIEGLEKEKSGFMTEFEVKNEKINILSGEIERLREKEGEMKKEIDKSVDDKKALNAIMSRASDLETEVSRLQHDLISTMSENEEARGELQRVKNEIGVLKRSVIEKDEKIERIEKEKVSLEKKIERIEKEKVSLEKKIDEIVNESKTVNDVRSRDLVDRDMKFKEKEDEYVLLQKMVKKGEMEKISLEEELKMLEEKFKEMESKVKILEIEVELSEKVINELKEKNTKLIDTEKANGCSKVQWPACAIASTGTVAAAAAALCYFTYAKRR